MNLMLICALLYINFISKNLQFAAEVVYTNINSDVCLICKIIDLPNEITWIGPDKMVIAVGFMVLGPPYSLNGTTTSSLCMKNITESYVGFYHCYGKNITVKEEYEIKLQRYIKIANRSENGTICIRNHKELTLECTITPAMPTVILEWTANNKSLSSNNTNVLRYTFTPSQADDKKTYTCKANNSEFLNNVLLLVIGRPSPPISLKFETSSTTIRISWTPGNDGNSQQTFVIEYRTHHQNIWQNSTVPGYYNTKTIEGLSPNTSYVVRMYSSNAINKSEFTKEETVTTKEKESLTFTSSPSRLYTFLLIPVSAIVAFAVYIYIRGTKSPEVFISCLKIERREHLGQNAMVDEGLGGIANDMYRHPPNLPPRGQNDEVQVYSSFDRRHNITLSTHAHAVLYDVRPKPDRTRKKTSKAKENNVDPTKTSAQNSASAIDTQEPHELNYVEVTFNSKTEAEKLRIHGQQSQTDYVDIDFTKKLRNLPYTKDDNDSDDDFETANEVNKMKRKTRLQE